MASILHESARTTPRVRAELQAGAGSVSSAGERDFLDPRAGFKVGLGRAAVCCAQSETPRKSTNTSALGCFQTNLVRGDESAISGD